MYEPPRAMRDRVRRAEADAEAVRKFLELVPDEPEVEPFSGPFTAYVLDLERGEEMTPESVERAKRDGRTFDACFDEIMRKLMGEVDEERDESPDKEESP